MSGPTVTYEAFDIVVVPFPFTDRRATKRRPALVLSGQKSFNAPAGHLVLAMITSAENAPWPLDTPITDLASAGLPMPSVVRMKLFTLDAGLALRRAGRIGNAGRKAVQVALSRLLGRSTGIPASPNKKASMAPPWRLIGRAGNGT